MGWKGGKGRGYRNFGFGLKRIQTVEFKFEFEFQQPKTMLQHECNN
jgi:hypothetical protein